jgi:hypothetical protein
MHANLQKGSKRRLSGTFSTPASRTSKMELKPDGAIKIRVPWKPQQRDRKTVIYPNGITPPNGAPKIVDNTILKALGRAFRWQRMLESGEYGSLTELAKAEKINLSYFGRVLRLTLLAPDIVEALLNGSAADELTLEELLQPFSPKWNDQRTTLKIKHQGQPSALQGKASASLPPRV